MENQEILQTIQRDLFEIKKTLANLFPKIPVSENWIPRLRVMKFFNYGTTQMTAFEKIDGVIVSKIGKRKFIHRDSIEKLLDKNIVDLLSTADENKAQMPVLRQ